MYKIIDHLAAEDSISTFVIMSLVLELGTKIILIFERNCQHEKSDMLRFTLHWPV